MPNNLTPEILDAIEAADKAATPGPWEYWDKRGEPCYDSPDHKKVVGHLPESCQGVLIGGTNATACEAKDSRLIALNRNHTPALVAALRGALRVVEVAIGNGYGTLSLGGLDQAVVDFRHDNPGLLPGEECQ